MKKIIAGAVVLFAAASLFAQSADYTKYLTQGKEYESQKKWCHALESYYDAMGTDDEPELKEEAYNRFTEIKTVIESGNPGIGKFNVFKMHDEWKNLLIDAEQVGSSFSRYKLILGDLVQGDLDYTTQTASYSSKITYEESDRYKNTIVIVQNGYKNAYRDDWSADLPREWDFESLFDYKFNIVDESGRELVKGVRWLLGKSDKVTFTGVTLDIMDLIDNGKAYINPVASYLRKFPETQLDMGKNVIICWNNREDKKYIQKYIEWKKERIAAEEEAEKERIAAEEERIAAEEEAEKVRIAAEEEAEKVRIAAEKLQLIKVNWKDIPYKNQKMLETEVTQALYEAVMGTNPSKFKGKNNPVECVSWYDAVYFCNLYSRANGLEPVYSVDGKTNVRTWNYTPHKGDSLKGNITQNIAANGFRLPTEEEWKYAAKGGENYTYSGSNKPDEVGWYNSNSGNKTHPVAQKKANGYGLYDMTGNVWEWVWNVGPGSSRYRCYRGGSYYDFVGNCEVSYGLSYRAYYQFSYIGFRIVCSSSN